MIIIVLLIPCFVFARSLIWTGANGDNKWRTNGNWDVGSSPSNTDDVIFNDGSIGVYLDHSFQCVCQSITMTSGYTGNFNFNSNKLTVSRSADFSTGGTVMATGTLQLNCEAASTITPSATQKLPAIIKQGDFTMMVTGAGLNTVGLSMTAGTGTWSWGTEGLTHTVDGITASSGSMDFGNSRVQVTFGNATFAGMTTITAGTGILQFTHATNTQILTPLNATQTHPAIVHSGAGMLQLAGSKVVTDSFHNSAGMINFNGQNVQTIGNFTIINGTTTTIYNSAGTNSLGGRTITVGGNATLKGQSGNLLNVNPTTVWYIPTAGALEAVYARLQKSNATGGSKGILTQGIDISGNINWVRTSVWIGLGADNNWSTPGNWSGNVTPGPTDTLMLFDATSTKNCILDVSPTILRVRFEPGYTGTFDFAGNVLTVTWHADFRSGGDFIPNGGRIDLAWPSTQFLYPRIGDTLPAIRKIGTGTVSVSENPLNTISVTSNLGTWDWGDNGLTHAIGSLSTAGGSTMDFGNSTVRITSGNADLSGVSDLVSGTGILEFTASSPTTQVLTPAPGGTPPTHPAIIHSGTGTLQLATRTLKTISITQTAGLFDFNGQDVTTTGDFTISSATASAVFQSLAGRTITVGSNAQFTGSTGFPLALNPGSAWTLVVTGNLTADYVDLNNSTASAAKGTATNSISGGTTSGWTFVRVWNNGSGDKYWNTAANWTRNRVPNTIIDSVVFNATTTANCTLNTSIAIKSVTFTGAYNGAFSFADNTLTVAAHANFSGNESIAFGPSGALTFNTSGSALFKPKSGATFPPITKQGSGKITLSTNGLTAGTFSMSAGTWDWGDEGLTHQVSSLSVTGGTEIDFGNSAVRISSGNATFSGISTVTAGSGILDFTHASNTQTLTPLNATQTHPEIRHTGAGRIQFAGSNLKALAFSNTAGTIDFNGRDIQTTGNFTISNGTTSTIFDAAGTSSLGGRIIRVQGNALFNGQSGNLLNLNPSSVWNIRVDGTLNANYARLSNSDASGYSQGVLSNGDASGGGNVNWKTASIWLGTTSTDWNTAANWDGGVPNSTTPALFNAGSNNCDLTAAAAALKITFTSGYAGTFNFNGQTLTVYDDADVSTGGAISGSGTLAFNVTGSKIFKPKLGATFPAVSKAGAGTITVSTNALLAGSFSQSAGTWDWGDAGLTHSVSSIATSGGNMDFGTSRVIVATTNANLSGLTVTTGLTSGTGTIEFTHGSNTQVLTPHSGSTHPHVAHSGAGILQLATNDLTTLSFTQTAGRLDFNSRNITTASSGNFSITNGSNNTFINLAGRTITIAGKGTFNGQSGSYVNMNTTSNHFIVCSGSLQASYATLGRSRVSGTVGYAVPASDANNNLNWKFAVVWDASHSTLWSRSQNWTPQRVPLPDDPVLFDATGDGRDCDLDQDATVASITFTSTYTKKFSFSNKTLSILANSDFSSGGDFLPGTGTIECRGAADYTIIPRVNDTLPAISKTGASTVTVSTNPLISSGTFLIDDGEWNWGSSGHTHYLSAIECTGGDMTFGNSTVKMSGDADFTGSGTLSNGTGVLELIAGSGTQVFRPKAGTMHPAMVHSGAGTMALGDNNLICLQFTQNAGSLDFSGYSISTNGDFSITGGRSTTFSNLDGKTITVGGNATFSGTAGDSLNMDPVLTWNIDVTGALTATYAVIKNSVAGVSSGEAAFSRDAGNNIGWNFPDVAQPTPVWSRTDLTNVRGAAIGENKIFVGAGSTLHAILLSGASKGTDDWSYSSGYGTCRQPSYTYSGGAYLIVAAQGNRVVGVQDGSGTKTVLFTTEDLGVTPGAPYVSPDDASFYVVYDGKLSKRDMTTGAKVWGSDKTVTNASTAADIVISSNYIYVGTTTGTVNQYDVDGTLKYSYAIGTSIDFPLLVQGSTMYITPATNELHARNSSNMSEKWASPVTLADANTGPAFMAAQDSLLYVAAGTKVQQIVDRGVSGGAIKWSYDASVTIQSGPIEYNGIVYFGRNSGRYYAINASNPSTPVGDWPYQSASGNATTGPWIDVTNDQVLFGTDAGNLHAFSAETP